MTTPSTSTPEPTGEALEAEVYTESSPQGSAVGLRLGTVEARLSFGAALLMARNLEEAVAEQVSDENWLRIQQAAEREPHGPFRIEALRSSLPTAPAAPAPVPATPLPGGDDLRERLADLCHTQWSGWMEYLFSKCENGKYFDGVTRSKEIPVWAVERWTRQMRTPYADLSSEEKDSDRAEADRFIALLSSLSPVPAAEDVRELAEAIERDLAMARRSLTQRLNHSEDAELFSAHARARQLLSLLVPAPSNPQERK